MPLATAFFKKLKYLPALLPDAALIASLAPAAAPQSLFSYGNLGSTGRIVTLRSLQFAQSSADVGSSVITLSADKYATPSVAVLSMLPMLAVRPEGALELSASRNQLSARVQNLGAAALQNFGANWSVLVEEPSVALREKFGLPLTDAERALGQALKVIGSQTPRGVLPRSFDWLLENEFRNQVLDAPILGTVLPSLSANNPVLMAEDHARAGEVLAIRALFTTQGSGTDNLTMIVQVDDDYEFLELNAYGGGVALPMAAFILAEQQVAIYALSTQTSLNVAMSMRTEHLRKTDEIAYRMGAAVAHATEQKIEGGVL